MSETTNYHLYQPEAGESGWAEPLNNNFTVIDSQMKTNQNAISSHTGEGIKHQANNIAMPDGSTVETNISDLKSGKANVSHNHQAEEIDLGNGSNVGQEISNINSKLDIINNTLDILLPDLTNVEINAVIDNVTQGIRIIANTNPVINITFWGIKIEKNGVLVVSITNSSNVIYVPEESLNGVEDNDTLQITITAHSGTNFKSITYSHVYNHINSDLENKLLQLEQNLTIGNILDAFSSDPDAIQALANVLQTSNTLAQKIAELN